MSPFFPVAPWLPVFALRILSPTIVLLSTLSLFFVHPSPPPSPSAITSVVVVTRVPRRGPILALLSLSACTFLFDGLTFVVFTVLCGKWSRHTGLEYNAVFGLAAFAGMAALGSYKDILGVAVWTMKRIKVAITLAFGLDLALVVLIALSIHPFEPTPSRIPLRTWLHFSLPAFRVLLLACLLATLLGPRLVYSTVSPDDGLEHPVPTSRSFLLAPEAGTNVSTGMSTGSDATGDASKYGTFRTTRSNLQRSAPTTRAATPAPSTAPDSKADAKPEISLDPSWSEIWKRIKRLSPYLWPSKSQYLQLLAAVCIIILVIGRAVNLAMPLVLGQLIRILAGKADGSPWTLLLVYVGLRFLQGSGGLAAIRDALWVPVMQYSDREMSQLSFDHLLNLSFAWHTRRKTGEILRVLDRGAAINHTFELILFNIVPTFVDILIALVAFVILFEWSLAVVIFFVMFAYVAASVVLTRWRTKLRRQMNERDIVTRGIHTDCLLNYETVKYFGGEDHEGERYRDAVREYQSFEYRVIISLNILNLVQNFIITLGLLVGSLIVANRVTEGISDSGDFVTFITYLGQLYGPLNQLGYIYRSINQSLVDTEKLLALLNEPTEINDKPNAPDLIVTNGEIEFDNVSFSYDGRSTALNGVSFKVPKGSSVALVGESGSGKSTILRLLYRFYDLQEGEGRIMIDGQDIRDVTQKSLRRAIGVVPQDPVLFNSSISYNIGYGKFGASTEEIETAAKSAQMHERIMSFPDGYDTKVGERGVRLSGGEKQRVAIARTLLKNPPILLLDEATSALDTSTEKDIQKALQNLMQGRSSLSIAHRLSTIASAELILVLKDGQIVEQGTHKELLALDGLFASMWADQVSSTDDIAASIAEAKKETTGYVVDDNEAVTRDSTNEEPALAALTADSQAGPAPASTENGVTEAAKDPTHAQPSMHAVPTSETSDQLPSVSKPDDSEPRSTPALESSLKPIAFPSTDIAETLEQTPIVSPTPAVTFGASVDSPPSRTGTPDVDAETKRKRISSQNFQRLARRISITTRRQSSSFIPGLKRSESPRVSSDDGSRVEGSMMRTESPASSIKGDIDKGKAKKKEKKDKKDKGAKTSV